MAVVFKHACELARNLPQVVVVLIAKGITYSPKFAIPMVAQAVEAGHHGGLGVLAARLVEEDHKHERAPAVRHHRAARAAAPSHSFVGP